MVRRSPPNSNNAENAARSIRGGMMTSTPCPFSDASIAMCCLDLIARVIVKTMACRMGRPSASSSSSTSASARTPIVASSVVARMGVSTRSACDMARDTNRDATPSRSTMTMRPSASCCFMVRTISDSPTSDLTAMRGGRVPRARPDCDGAVSVTVEDDNLCARMSKLGRQDHGGRGFTGPSLGRSDGDNGHGTKPIYEITRFTS